ncbi:MAG: MurR/RpiR family transcriptional regulator [Chloroflexi bacterium]|nr:MurR/RpiR family transcriptional regulator [Chloroflexota bacterium]
MTHEEKIREMRPHLSPSFLKLADFVLDSYTEAAFMTATELADHLEVDAATVVRFAQRLGYPGYPNLQREVRAKVKADLMLSAERATPAPKSVEAAMELAFDKVSGNLLQTRRALRAADIGNLVSALDSAKRIFLLAEGPSLPVAQQIESILQAGNFLVYGFGGGMVDMAHLISTTRAGDLVIAVETEMVSPFINRALEAARSRGAKTASIVGAASQEVTRHADIVLAAFADEDRGVTQAALSTVVFSLATVLKWKFSKRYGGYQETVNSVQAFLEGGNPKDLVQ